MHVPWLFWFCIEYPGSRYETDIRQLASNKTTTIQHCIDHHQNALDCVRASCCMLQVTSHVDFAFENYTATANATSRTAVASVQLVRSGNLETPVQVW